MKAKRIFAAVLAVAVTFIGVYTVSFSSEAYSLSGNSTYQNGVTSSIGSVMMTSIQTNYHAGSINGVIATSSYDTFKKAVGTTDEDIRMGGGPVMYVADSQCGTLARELIKSTADSVKGSAVSIIEIMMFRYTGQYNQPITTTAVPVKITTGIPVSVQSSANEYAMIRLHDGVATILTDLDTDPKTLTFETDKFSVYALLVAPAGSLEAYKPAAIQAAAAAATAAATTAATTAASNLDDVPKTGDMNVLPIIFALAAVGFAGIVIFRKKYEN